MRYSPLTIVAVLIGILTVGNARAGQERLAAAMRDTRAEIVNTRDQLQVTVDAISALVNQKKGDLKAPYDTFVAQVGKTQAAAAATKARAQKMQSEADTHFNGWKAEIDTINNPKLKKKAMKRLESVQKNYANVTARMKDAGDKFDPYLSDLADMQKMLATDLTPSGVKNLRGTVSDAKFHLANVRAPVYDAINGLDKMQKELGTTVSQ